MKRIILAAVVILGVTIGAISFARWKSSTRDIIIKMAEKGASEPEMLAAVDAGHGEALTANDLITLKKAGVPNSVVLEMQNKSGTR